MRDAPGQAADCLHLLRLAQLFLAAPQRFLVALARRDVAGDDEHAGDALLFTDRVARHEVPPRFAIARQAELALAALALGRRRDVRGEHLTIVGVCEHRHLTADERRILSARRERDVSCTRPRRRHAGVHREQPRGLVRRRDCPVTVGAENHIRRHLQKQAIALLRPPHDAHEGELDDGEGDDHRHAEYRCGKGDGIVVPERRDSSVSRWHEETRGLAGDEQREAEDRVQGDVLRAVPGEGGEGEGDAEREDGDGDPPAAPIRAQAIVRRVASA